MDGIDKKILMILQIEGRISNQELADRVGLSPSPCLRRVRLLEDAGLITGYNAVVDAKKLGLALTALIHVSLNQHRHEHLVFFEEAIARHPEVVECLLISGQQADYQLKTTTRDMDALQRFLLEVTKIPGVGAVHSSFVMRTVLQRSLVPATD